MSKPCQPRPVTMTDRQIHAESLICSFICENNLPLNIAPKLIELCKEMSRDQNALSNLSMERPTAAYKIKYGLAVVDHVRLVHLMKTTPFSLNIDESTSKGNKKRILNVLVNLFSHELGKCITSLYCAMEMTVVNAQTVFDMIREKLESDSIPFTNFVSVLTDSAAYMVGEHNGFQAKLREVAPHLVNIDADVCHHMHNIVKMFMDKLDTTQHLSKLLDDIYRDFDLSADLRKDLMDISELLKKPTTAPLQRAPHRWTSMLDATNRFLELLDALTLFYYSWLNNDQKTDHTSIVASIMAKAKLTSEGRCLLKAIMRRLKCKNLTRYGLARKQRIAMKLFQKRDTTLLYAGTCSAVLPMFKAFIVTFETKEPMVHKLHEEICAVFIKFLTCFMKNEKVKDKKLHSIQIDNRDDYLPRKQVFCGSQSDDILVKMDTVAATEFRKSLLNAYSMSAIYMQQKLPLKNCVLKSLSALDPALHGHHKVVDHLKKLYNFFPSVCPNDNTVKDAFIHAASHLQNIDASVETQLDLWWGDVFKIQECKPLIPLVSACLSIFTGPRVESSFSMMNAIITSSTNRICVDTYEAIQKVKYRLLIEERPSTEIYHRPDIQKSPVDESEVYYMHTAAARKRAFKTNIIKNKTDRIPKPKIQNRKAIALPSTTAAYTKSVPKSSLKRKLKYKKESASKKICTQEIRLDSTTECSEKSATTTSNEQEKTTSSSEKSGTTTITSYEPESVSVRKPAAKKPCAQSTILGFFKQK